ncbi:MAG TPA: carbohydrate ABC transporter permease [Acetobacteraceae bacterium]|jgi:multiple sugar transport system permease protein|nr:carbohydrate ABC transporter permease [Acetobacteraceae bacterium]
MAALMRRSFPAVCAAIVAIGLLFPIAWMLSTAIKEHADVFVYPPVWIPERITFAAFGESLRGDMLRFLLNSLLIAACTALLSTFTGALAAYPMSRRRTTVTRVALGYLIASIAFPAPLLLISTYIVAAQLDVIDTYAIVILVNCVFTLPVCIWTLKSFFDGLPIEVEEAAMIDGAGPLRTLLRIVGPMARPGLAAAAIYAFVTAWNDLTIGLTLTTSTDMRPLPAGISVTFLQEFQYQWPEMMAIATLATLPILALFVAFQNNFIEGVTAGAVKQ